MDIIECISDQLFCDIFIGFNKRFGNELKYKTSELLANCIKDDNLGSKFLTKAYTKCNNKDVLSPETMTVELVKHLIGNNLYSQKSVEEHLKFGNSLIKDLFIRVSKSTVGLYGVCIIKGSDKEVVQSYITSECVTYFNTIRSKYKVIGGKPKKDYKSLYKSLKTKSDNYQQVPQEREHDNYQQVPQERERELESKQPQVFNEMKTDIDELMEF
jgi:hypothetical protein